MCGWKKLDVSSILFFCCLSNGLGLKTWSGLNIWSQSMVIPSGNVQKVQDNSAAAILGDLSHYRLTCGGSANTACCESGQRLRGQGLSTRSLGYVAMRAPLLKRAV